jgi:hypothetical protein
LADWVTKRLQESSAEQEQEAVANELRLHRIRVMRAFGADVWRDLQTHVKRDVLRYEVQRKSKDQAISYSDLLLGFSVGTTGHYPVVTLALEPDPSGVSAHGAYSYASAFGESVPSWSVRIDVREDDKDASKWYLFCGGEKFVSIEQLAGWLLRPLIDPQFRPPGQS